METQEIFYFLITMGPYVAVLIGLPLYFHTQNPRNFWGVVGIYGLTAFLFAPMALLVVGQSIATAIFGTESGVPIAHMTPQMRQVDLLIFKIIGINAALGFLAGTVGCRLS